MIFESLGAVCYVESCVTHDSNLLIIFMSLVAVCIVQSKRHPWPQFR